MLLLKKDNFYKKHWQTALVVLGFFIYTCLLTYPFIFKPQSTMIGPSGGDVASSTAKFQTIKEQGANPLVTPTINTLNAPTGIKSTLGIDRASFFSTVYLWVATSLFGSIAAHSLESFLGMFLSAIILFIFVKKVTTSNLAGIAAGVIFGYSTHMYSIARAAPTYTHMWLLILPLLAFYNLAHKGINKKTVALAALSVIPGIFWTPYFALHTGIVGASCFLTWFVISLWQKTAFKKVIITSFMIGSVWAIGLVIYWLAGTSNGMDEIPKRGLNESVSQSAHPLMYLLPASLSVWGQTLNAWVVSKVPRADGITLYVGLSSLLLATFAIIGSFFTRKIKLSKPIIIATGLAGVASMMCFIFSLNPSVHVFGHDYMTPNGFIAVLVPALRAGQRFVMPLTGCLAILSGIGLFLLIKSTDNKYIKYTLAWLIICLIWIDNMAQVSEFTTQVNTYPSLIALSKLPKGNTVQYQASAITGKSGPYPCILQAQHHQKLINDCNLGRSLDNINLSSPLIMETQKMELCQQFKHLQKTADIKYVIVNNYDTPVLDCFNQQDTKTIKDNTYSVIILK